MTILSAPEEAREELIGALVAWDWTNYFPSDYSSTLTKGVQVTTEWPSDQLQNIVTTTNGMWAKPIVSVMDLGSAHEDTRRRALGNVIGLGAQAGQNRYGAKLTFTFIIDCWADLQVGAGDQAQRIGGGVNDCVFVNRNALTAFRRLTVTGGRLLSNDAAQLWRYTLSVTGTATQSYDQ